MKCQKCGGTVADNSSFCEYCGTKIEQIIQEVPIANNSQETTNNNTIKATLNYEIKGDSFPIVEFNLKAGDKIISESGAMAWKDPSITMETTTDGGFKKVIGRLFSTFEYAESRFARLSDV